MLIGRTTHINMSCLHTMFKLTYQTVSGNTIHIKELLNAHYLDIVKYITNDDNDGLALCFNEITQELTNNAVLTCLDVFLIMLELRSVCVGNELQLQIEGFNGLIKLSIGTIIDKLKSVNLTDYISYIPKQLTGQKYEIEDFLMIDNADDLPASVLIDLNKNIKQINEITTKINIINKNDKAGIREIPFNLFDGTLFEVLKLIFKDNLLNYYQVMYTLSSKAHVDICTFKQMTPVESKILVSFYAEEMKKEEDEAKKITNGNVYNKQ